MSNFTVRLPLRLGTEAKTKKTRPCVYDTGAFPLNHPGVGARQLRLATAKSALKDEAVTGTLRRATGSEQEQYAGAFKYSAKPTNSLSFLTSLLCAGKARMPQS